MDYRVIFANLKPTRSQFVPLSKLKKNALAVKGELCVPAACPRNTLQRSYLAAQNKTKKASEQGLTF